MAMTYGNVYVARVAMGANDAQTLQAFLEAEAYDGPSLIIAYSHCIAHGYDMRHGLEQQKAAVALRPLAALPLQPRPGPRRAASRSSSTRSRRASRSRSTPTTRPATRCWRQSDPETARRRLAEAQQDVLARWQLYEQLAAGPAAPPAPEARP